MKPYIPIDCNLVDYIEMYITQKAIVGLVYVKDGIELSVTTQLLDRFTNSLKEEYIVIKNNEQIRMDKIVMLNEIKFK